MKTQQICRINLFAAALALCLGGAWQFSLRSVAGQTTDQSADQSTLHGAAAVDRLKRDGQYDSLQEAMSQARFTVSRAEATPLGRAAWHAPNPAAGYDAYVTEAGVSIALNEKSYLSLHLRRIGYGASMQAVAPGEVSGEKQTINLTREGGLREWYINGPEGLEQGFTLSEAPGGRQAGVPLRLALQVSAGWQAVASEDGRAVTLSGAGAAVEYGKLVVRDSLGCNLAARLTVAEEQVVIEVEDSEALYPLTIDPLFTLQQKLTAADGAAQDFLGHAVALDGDTALVGAPYDDVTHPDQGSAYVFVRQGAKWTQQAQLTAQDGANLDLFGWAVALDGDTALVGAYNGPGAAGPDQGAVYVFTRNGATWSQQARLNAGDGTAAGLFGTVVTLDGETALVGAPNYRVSPILAPGAAYVFVRNGSNWTQQARLTANDGEDNDWFGAAVALDENTALIGVPADDVGTKSNQGSAYIFTRNGALWGARQKLTTTDSVADDHFGNAVALEGERALIAAPLYGSDDRGKVFTFRRGAAGWTQTDGTIAPNPTAGAYFGVSLALDGDTMVVGASLGLFSPGVDHRSAYVFVDGGEWLPIRQFGPELGTANDRFGYAVALDGDTVLVGAYWSDATAADQGAAYAFVLHDSRHVEQQRLTANDGAANDYFGETLALDGDTLVVGTELDTISANAEQGSVYVFTRNGTTWTQQQKLTANDGAAYDYFGSALALSGDTLVVGAKGDDIGANANQGSVYVFTRNGATWTQQQKLTAADGAADDDYGFAVALDNDTIVVGARLDDIGANKDQGSAYVFTRNGTTWTQQQKLTANDGAANDEFGFAVALSGDTVAVGAYFDTVTYASQGSAYVFTRNGTAWTQQQKLTASDGRPGAYFGGAVALDGDRLLVGAFGDAIGANVRQGSAYVFSRAGVTWMFQGKLIANDGGANDNFGGAVALENQMLVVGASGATIGTKANQGSAYVFSYVGGWHQQQKLIASDGAAGDYFGGKVALSGDKLVVGAGRDNIEANNNQGSAYVFFSPACPTITIAPESLPNAAIGATYNQQLTANSGSAGEEFQFTVTGGALPPGLTLGYGSGVLHGTPTATGIYRFTITARASLSRCPGSRSYTLRVTPPCPALTIYPATLPNGGLDIEYNLPLTAAGGLAPYSYSVTAGALPAGLSLSNAGVLTGTFTASGSFNFTVTATDANYCQGTRTYTLVVTGCFYNIAPNPQSFSAISQTGNVLVATTASCAWTAQSNNAWIKLSDFGGTGSGTVHFTVAANSGAQRTGTVTIAGQTLTVTQAALPADTPRLMQLTPNAVHRGTNGLILTVNGTAFTASQRVQWNGINYETSFVNATQLRAVIPAAELAREGTAAVVVVDTTKGTRSNLRIFRILGAVAHASAASYDTVALAPDSIVAAFGENLATEVRAAEGLPLPTELAGTTVTVRDSQGATIRAPLFFVAPNQINYLMPPGVAIGIATVTITNGQGIAIESLTEISAVAPGLFAANASGEGAAAALVLRIRAGGEQVYEPVARYDAPTQSFVLLPIDLSNDSEQVYLVLFGTGIRRREALEYVRLKLGETELPVDYAGAAPRLEGVDQVNVRLTASLRGRGEQPVVLRVNDEATNGVKVHFQ